MNISRTPSKKGREKCRKLDLTFVDLNKPENQINHQVDRALVYFFIFLSASHSRAYRVYSVVFIMFLPFPCSGDHCWTCFKDDPFRDIFIYIL